MKPEGWGVEISCTADTRTGILLYLEVNKGKDVLRDYDKVTVFVIVIITKLSYYAYIYQVYGRAPKQTRKWKALRINMPPRGAICADMAVHLW